MTAGGGGGISTATVLVLGLVAIFAIAAVAAIVIVLFARSPAPAAAQPATVTTITVQAATPSDSASASASASAAAVSTAPLTEEELDEIEGNYKCAMDDTPQFPCRISNSVLEKLGGSQRFRGPITKNSSGGFSFSGTFFCPFGDCTHPVACTFARTSAGHYACRFGPNSVPGGGPGGEHVVLTKVR